MAQSDKAHLNVVDRGLARHGHVSYLEIPAADLELSAHFYEAVFGWTIHRRGPEKISFEDNSGDLIGRWQTGRHISREPGLVPYIYVNSIDEIVERISANCGEIVKPPYVEGDLWVAVFRDLAGNMMGIWQAGPR